MLMKYNFSHKLFKTCICRLYFSKKGDGLFIIDSCIAEIMRLNIHAVLDFAQKKCRLVFLTEHFGKYNIILR